MRLSVSDIDSLRYYQANETMPIEELLKRLRREQGPTEAMAAGTALHSILEDADECELTMIERDGFTFSFNIDDEVELPDIRELKAEAKLGDVTLVGKVDAIEGLTVYDHKLTDRYDPERFMDAMQWRCYLSIFGCDKFVYNVFEGRQDRNGIYQINSFHKLPLYRYPSMEDDVRKAVADFRSFAAEHMPEKLAA